MKPDELITADRRLELWVQLNVLATTIQEVTDWWWHIDEGLQRAEQRRAGVLEHGDQAGEVSD